MTVDLALRCQPRMAEGGILPPHSVLAPGSTLRSVPTVALPFARVNMDDTTPGGEAGSNGSVTEKSSARSAPIGVRAESTAGRA
jgi:hypothetical protein